MRVGGGPQDVRVCVAYARDAIALIDCVDVPAQGHTSAACAARRAAEPHAIRRDGDARRQGRRVGRASRCDTAGSQRERQPREAKIESHRRQSLTAHGVGGVARISASTAVNVRGTQPLWERSFVCWRWHWVAVSSVVADVPRGLRAESRPLRSIALLARPVRTFRALAVFILAGAGLMRFGAARTTRTGESMQMGCQAPAARCSRRSRTQLSLCFFAAVEQSSARSPCGFRWRARRSWNAR